MTSREFNALVKVWQDARRVPRFFYAGLQAAIHNAWLRPEGHPAFSMYDWLPDEDRPEDKPRTLEEIKLNNRMVLFEAAAALASVRQDPEMQAQVDALANKDWGKVN